MRMNAIMGKGLGFLALVAGLSTAMPPSSAGAATRDEQTAACKGDAIKLCTFAIPNEAKITACMQKKIDRLSPRCRAMFEQQEKPKPKPKPKK